MLRRLTLEEAAQLYERMPLAPRPATLHPAYVRADASRSALLQPTYLGFEHRGQWWLHCLHMTKIGSSGLMDASSAYGYGGPVSSSADPSFVSAAWAAYVQWMREHRVVVEYVRFHPLLGNQDFYGGTASDNRDVVVLDLQQADIAAGYAQRLRHAIRKAERYKLEVVDLDLAEAAPRFGAFYRQAMRGLGADAFYCFGDEYFRALAESGLSRLVACRSTDAIRGVPPGAWLAASLLLDGHQVTEYHLAATSEAGKQVAAASFLLHEAARAARERGQLGFYLGGGTDARPDNPLLFFKSSFSRRRLRYRTGCTIFDATEYDRLRSAFPREAAAHPDRPIFYRTA